MGCSMRVARKAQRRRGPRRRAKGGIDPNARGRVPTTADERGERSNGGGRSRTCDLRVMSPAGTATPLRRCQCRSASVCAGQLDALLLGELLKGGFDDRADRPPSLRSDSLRDGVVFLAHPCQSNDRPFVRGRMHVHTVVSDMHTCQVHPDTKVAIHQRSTRVAGLADTNGYRPGVSRPPPKSNPDETSARIARSDLAVLRQILNQHRLSARVALGDLIRWLSLQEFAVQRAVLDAGAGVRVEQDDQIRQKLRFGNTEECGVPTGPTEDEHSEGSQRARSA